MISAKDVLKAGRNNAHDRWNGAEGGAAERMAARMVVPMGRQSFRAKPGDTFFAIGSCFARNVEERLELAGARVTSRNIAVRDLGNASAREGGVFNKYTPVSILQELQWAAGEADYPETALLPVGGGEVYDPYLSGKAGRGSVAELMARRAEVGRYFAQAFEADVVVLTLGLVESWIDRETGLALNETPAPTLLAREGKRFGFEVLSLERCEAAVADSVALLRRHGKRGQKIVLTVSPVPLGRTFTDMDVIVANTMAKSTLRVAAHRLSDRIEGLDYFPSYEAVMHSDPNLCWQRDRRHVSDVIVGRIIETFLNRYGATEEAPQDFSDALSALDSDPTFQKWSEMAGDETALIARLNQEVNKYKNMVIKLQGELKKARLGDT
ncbi:GSCFA domain-containing protein [Salipiger marinus]|uniref:GSCFA domain-containing protein n=1 Tax=Salipiger marinus TaxID=555512 RepID=UPI002C05DC1E|nr:GSCFA domain-containing protein [Salipiger manganoxidans]MEB3421081.1 GSCFA domain-containing protein [Salipiger manganoxidans]